MATEIAQAYVQIIPSMDGIKNNLSNILSGQTEAAGTTAGKGFASKFGAGLKRAGVAMAAGVAASGAAVGAVVKKAVEGYASFEQLTGGVETLFGAGGNSLKEYAKQEGKTIESVKGEYNKLMAAQGAVFNNAANAYKTAGLSANDYMETVASFSASLISSVGGNTQKAAKIADQAIVDMSDNANKMGSSMESIQNAYQGFAKQNYTMLDNLKLGYGGTKTEMARLLADASALSGVKYNIDNLEDVYNAIHVIQENMGITGTTAKEAASTIEGSVSSMKSAWDNLIVGVADDNADFNGLINNFVDSAITAAGNILPRVEIALNGIGKLVEGLAQKLLPKVLKRLPKLINKFIPVILNTTNSITEAVTNAMPNIINAIVKGLKGVLKALPEMAKNGVKLITAFVQSIAQALPTLIPVITQSVMGLVNVFLNPTTLTALLNAGLQLILGLAEGITTALPQLIEMIPTIVSNICTTISEFLPTNIPLLIDAALQTFMAIVDAIPLLLDTLIPELPRIIDTVCTSLLTADSISKILEAAVTFFYQIGVAIGTATPKILAGIAVLIGQLVMSLLKGIKECFNAGVKIGDSIRDGLKSLWQDFKDIGANILEGIWDGINSKVNWLKDKINGVKDAVVGKFKKMFNINSPSRIIRDEVGLPIAEGFAAGIYKGSNYVDKALNSMGIKKNGRNNVRFTTNMSGVNAATKNYNFNIPVSIGNGKVDAVVAQAGERNAYRFAY